MTKSLTATYFGILQKQGKINIMSPAPVTEWQKDDRAKITLNDLLHMNSGLEWEENYSKICDATTMLFQAEDMSKCQAKKQAAFKPNTQLVLLFRDNQPTEWHPTKTIQNPSGVPKLLVQQPIG